MVVGKLYMLPLSPAVRSVLLCEKALAIELEHVLVDMAAGKHLAPEYLKLNPQHTVPTYVDQDGTTICDSHAILVYLVEKYGKDDSLYPKDLATRAIIDQRLHLDSGTLFPALRQIVKPMLMNKEKGPTPNQAEDVVEVYDFLNSFLDGNHWFAGHALTIADFSIITNVSTVSRLVPIDKKFRNLLSWIKRCEQLPYYELNASGVDLWYKFIEPFVIKN